MEFPWPEFGGQNDPLSILAYSRQVSFESDKTARAANWRL
jgi:hypothetical protein